MAIKQRKVSFYRLSIERQLYVPKRNTMQTVASTNSDVEDLFNRIYSNEMRTLTTGGKAINIETAHNNYVVEVISYGNHFVFIKIGQQNAANTVGIRDSETLEIESVPMTETQQLELYTYCLIDFQTCIVSYIGINGAPRITAIRKLFDKFLIQDHGSARLGSIMTEDILRSLVKKNIIGKISVSVAIPSDQILAENIGLNAYDFDALRNVKTRTAEYKIVGIRNKNIFEDSSNLSDFITSVKSKFGDGLKKVNVNAQNFNEPMQTYDLLEYNFTKMVVLGNSENHNTLNEVDFKIALEETYQNNREELLIYIN